MVEPDRGDGDAGRSEVTLLGDVRRHDQQSLHHAPERLGTVHPRFRHLLLGTLIMGFATAVYVGVNAGAGPRDSLMLAVARLAQTSVRRARTFIEVGVVIVGWLLGGPVGIGTLIFALTIGPAVQLAFRLMRVTPPQRVEAAPIAAADEP